MNIVALFQSYWPKHLKRAHIHTAPLTLNCKVLSSHIDDSSAAAVLLEFFIMFRTPSYFSNYRSQSATCTSLYDPYNTLLLVRCCQCHTFHVNMLMTGSADRSDLAPGDHLPTKTPWVCSACLVVQDLDKTGWVMTATTAAECFYNTYRKKRKKGIFFTFVMQHANRPRSIHMNLFYASETVQ